MNYTKCLDQKLLSTKYEEINNFFSSLANEIISIYNTDPVLYKVSSNYNIRKLPATVQSHAQNFLSFEGSLPFLIKKMLDGDYVALSLYFEHFKGKEDLLLFESDIIMNETLQEKYMHKGADLSGVAIINAEHWLETHC